MGLRVLVTRPQPGAGRTAARLQAAGFEPIVLPLSEIVAVAPALPALTARQRSPSPAPMRCARRRPRCCRCWRNAPVFAVGDETAAAARQAGFEDVRSSAGNAADLARDIVAAVGPQARIAYLSGRVRLDALEAELAAAGFEVEVVETYDTRRRAPSPEELAELDRRAVDVGARLFGERRAIACRPGGAARGNDFRRYGVHLHLAAHRRNPVATRVRGRLCRRDAG